MVFSGTVKLAVHVYCYFLFLAYQGISFSDFRTKISCCLICKKIIKKEEKCIETEDVSSSLWGIQGRMCFSIFPFIFAFACLCNI